MSTSSSPTGPSPTGSDSTGGSTGAIVGGALGGVIVILVCLGIYFGRKKAQSQDIIMPPYAMADGISPSANLGINRPIANADIPVIHGANLRYGQE